MQSNVRSYYPHESLNKNEAQIICVHVCQKQVSVAWISNYTPQEPVACSYLSMPQIPVFVTCPHMKS